MGVGVRARGSGSTRLLTGAGRGSRPERTAEAFRWRTCPRDRVDSSATRRANNVQGMTCGVAGSHEALNPSTSSTLLPDYPCYQVS